MALALYRTYRPGTLAEVIGQEHVTEPLARALAAGRTHHAYLFSGPRGCGKTSTARILARSLNCEQGPTPRPCGECRSCEDLAPNGPGSIDVIELDAATHRGIDDARELREKAIYAPAASRYRVYIIDEAHQLTNEAANALLKLIEEPPAHLRFIFATTEPDRIIPTIRSRTFHYPFRLVAARTLTEHLATVCRAEEVPAQPAALALVARAGAGSVRDSLSVLGQLLAGAGPQGLTHADAVAALGITDASLIDAFVEALAEGSVAAMFSVVDRVIAAGHDPRRFVADVLDRLRDLIVLRADPGALESGLVEVPDDAGDRLLDQARSLGLSELTRAADLVSAGLSDVKGATAPRLQLELLCARIAVHQAGADLTALLARMERLERVAGSERLETSAKATGDQGRDRATGPGRTSGTRRTQVARDDGEAGAPDAAGLTRSVGAAPGPGRTDGPPESPGAGLQVPPVRPRLRSSAAHDDTVPPGPDVGAGPLLEPGPLADPGTAADPGIPAGAGQGAPSGPPDRSPGADPSAAARPRASSPSGLTGAGQPVPPAAAAAGAGPPTGAVTGGQLARVSEAWPTLLAELAGRSRVAWTAFSSATPLSLSEGVLAVAVASPGAAVAITQRGHDLRLRQVLIDELGLDVTIDVVHDQGAVTRAGGSAANLAPPASGPSPAASRATSRTGQVDASPDPAAGAGDRSAAPVRPVGQRLAELRSQAAADGADLPDEPSDDDPEHDPLDGLALITRQLGAKPIGEIDHT